MHTLVDLFQPEPIQFGLRGDSYVWEALAAQLGRLEMPPRANDVIGLLHSTFDRIVGVQLFDDDCPEKVYREEFAHGGMSSGWVHLGTWSERLMPLLEARVRATYGGWVPRVGGPEGLPGPRARAGYGGWATPITLVQGDITQQRVDVIVNAANSSLLGGGGVDGAIHRAGGPEILNACRDLRASHYGSGLPPGQAVPTTAGQLPARWVVHTVGPVWAAETDRSDQLVSCYAESLRIADELGALTIAFPAISTGVFGWPMDDGARIAIETVRATDTAVEEVRFVLFGEDAYAAFAAQVR